MPDYKELIQLRLSLQRALLGSVGPRLAGVTAGIGEKKINIIAYYDTPIGEQDEETMSDVEGEVIADFDEGYRIETRVKATEGLVMLMFWAFVRENQRVEQS